MRASFYTGVAIAAAAAVSIVTPLLAETRLATAGPGLKRDWPGWYIAGSADDPAGPLTIPPFWRTGAAALAPRPAPAANPDRAPDSIGSPARCTKSTTCEMDGTRAGGVSDGEDFRRVSWRRTAGSYGHSYPFDLPAGGGNVTGVGVDSKDNVWVWQRNRPADPALFKFGPDHKLLFAVPAALTDHKGPFRGHGMRVDGAGNAWVIDQSGATVKKFSPDGKLLLTVGEKGRRGDWDEAKGQRLLWEPVEIGFAPGTDDVYIFEGHQDQSPNDVGSDDPANSIGAARVIHLDKNGKFINQWYGSQHGPGKFSSAHGSAVDPVTGDVWVGDRQEYRIVVFNANGRYLRTIPTRNLVCALHFDNHPGARFGEVWMATGMDGQVIKIDRQGNALLVAGGDRRGRGPGQFSESTNLSSDSKGRLVVADTQISRATLLTPPAAGRRTR